MSVQSLWAQFGDKYIQSLLTTWKLTALAFLIAFAVGLIVTVMRVSPIRPLRIAGDL